MRRAGSAAVAGALATAAILASPATLADDGRHTFVIDKFQHTMAIPVDSPAACAMAHRNLYVHGSLSGDSSGQCMDGSGQTVLLSECVVSWGGSVTCVYGTPDGAPLPQGVEAVVKFERKSEMRLPLKKKAS